MWQLESARVLIQIHLSIQLGPAKTGQFMLQDSKLTAVRIWSTQMELQKMATTLSLAAWTLELFEGNLVECNVMWILQEILWDSHARSWECSYWNSVVSCCFLILFLNMLTLHCFFLLVGCSACSKICHGRQRVNLTPNNGLGAEISVGCL